MNKMRGAAPLVRIGSKKGEVAGARVELFRLKSVEADLTICTSLSGDPAGDIKVAKPYLVRRTPFESFAEQGFSARPNRNGVVYDYTGFDPRIWINRAEFEAFDPLDVQDGKRPLFTDEHVSRLAERKSFERDALGGFANEREVQTVTPMYYIKPAPEDETPSDVDSDIIQALAVTGGVPGIKDKLGDPDLTDVLWLELPARSWSVLFVEPLEQFIKDFQAPPVV